MVGGTSLNGKRNYFSRFCFRFLFCTIFVFLNFDCLFVFQFAFKICDKFGLCLFRGHAADTFENGSLTFFKFFEFRFFFFNDLHFACKDVFFLLIRICSSVKRLFFLNDSFFKPLDFIPSFTDLFLSFRATSVNIFFRFEQSLFLLCLRCFYRLINNIFRFLFGRAYRCFSDLFAVKIAAYKSDCKAHNSDSDKDNYFNGSQG